MENEQETSAERAKRLSDEVQKLAPEVAAEAVAGLVGAVITSAAGLTKETEQHFRTAERQMDTGAVVSLMVQGALAAICEGHPDEDVRHRLYRAGRAIGDFMTERWRSQIEEKVEAAHRENAS